MDWNTYKKELLKNPEFKKTLKETELEYEIARSLIKARLNKGYTQKDLADRLQTTQSVISRVESAKGLPTLSFLKKLASALGTTIQVQFKA